MSKRGSNLSGGQSRVLLLDEPTSALDALTEQRVHERLAQAFPDACLVAAVHRMSLLTHFDRVVFMADGHIVDAGRPGDVAQRQPLFAAMRRGSALPREAVMDTSIDTRISTRADTQIDTLDATGAGPETVPAERHRA